MDAISYLLGKKSGGGGGGTDTRWQQIGYDKEPEEIQDGIDYAKEIMRNWDASVTDRSEQFKNDGKLVFFPKVDMSNITNASDMFYNSSLMYIDTDIDFSNIIKTDSMFEYSNIRYVNNVVINYPTVSSSTCSNMFASINDLKINNFIASTMSSGTAFMKNKNLTINTLGIRSGTRTLFDSVVNLDIKSIINYDNHTSKSRSFLNNCTLTNGALKEMLKYCKTLTGQSSSNKTLRFMGILQAQAELCTTFDEWTDLANAGWTTGYETT